MKIAFLGDSITEGIPGVSYVNILKRKLSSHTISNFGKGGDSVSSLLKRIKTIDSLNQYDIIVLFIGANDVFGKLSVGYKLLKLLMRQKWSKDKVTFENDYRMILDYIRTDNKKIIIVPPLLIGEDISNKWNVELSHYVKTIELIIRNDNHIKYIDVRSVFLRYLSDKVISNYLPYKLYDLLQDVKKLKTNEDVDRKSKSRKLHLTLDGVHVNSCGAQLIAKEILEGIKDIC